MVRYLLPLLLLFHEQARAATAIAVGYMQEGGLLYRAECLHTISQIVK